MESRDRPILFEGGMKRVEYKRQNLIGRMGTKKIQKLVDTTERKKLKYKRE